MVDQIFDWLLQTVQLLTFVNQELNNFWSATHHKWIIHKKASMYVRTTCPKFVNKTEQLGVEPATCRLQVFPKCYVIIPQWLFKPCLLMPHIHNRQALQYLTGSLPNFCEQKFRRDWPIQQTTFCQRQERNMVYVTAIHLAGTVCCLRYMML